jgi:glycosyltransferase involved in cell wall biosynthesis
MKIYYLSNSIIPSRFANTVNVMKMCEAFACQGHEVTLFSRLGEWFSFRDAFLVYGVEKNFRISRSWRPKSIFSKRVRSLIYLWQLKRKVQSSCSIPDLLYGRDVDSFLALHQLKIPMIIEEHGGSATINKLVKQEFIFKQPHFSRLVVITETLKDKYLSLFPELLQNKIIVAHSGATAFSTATEVASKKNWPGRSGCLQVGYVGQLYPGKGMEIISQLAPVLPQVDFHIVGGSNADIAYWKQKCLTTNMIFHGFVNHAQLDSYFKAFDVVLSPYNGNNHGLRSPLKLTEYMAARKAIISSDYPAFRELIADGQNGLLVSPDNVTDWIKAIHKLEDPVLRESLANRAFLDFSAHYSWKKRAEDVLDGLQRGF